MIAPPVPAFYANPTSLAEMIDHSVGRIVGALDRMGLSDDTIVIYTADHGFSLGHNGVWGHGLPLKPPPPSQGPHV